MIVTHLLFTGGLCDIILWILMDIPLNVFRSLNVKHSEKGYLASW